MRIHLFYLFSFVCINSIAQTGYWYGTDFIELWADESRGVFIQTEDSLDVVSNAYSRTLGNDEHFEKISENRFFISKQSIAKYPSFKGYVSKIYKDKHNSIVVVLQDIIISLREGINIDDIIETHKDLLKLKKTIDEDTYLLSSELDSSDDVLRLSAKLNELSGVNWCEPDMISDIKTSNTYFSLQYYLQNDGSFNGVPSMDINVVPAWQYITGNPNISVAVIDSGVERGHPDLTHVSDSGYTVGYPSLHGEPINAINDNNKAHGTACAGIIGATDNSIGIKGVASGVTIIPVNIFPYTASADFSGTGSSNEVADAIEWAYPRADVLNCSFKIGNPSNRVTQAITKARTYGRNGKGSVIVAGSGNDYPTTPSVAYPASLDGVIAVGGITCNGTVCCYSQRGANLDLVAFSGDTIPDGNITTTDISGTAGYGSGDYITYFSGTSAACPQVAGVAALMLSINPDLTESEVRSILTSTARKLPAYTYVSGRNNETGYGLVDAKAAVIGAMKISITGPTMLCTQEVYTIDNIPTNATVTWSLSGTEASNFTVQNNTPSANQCTITRKTNATFSSSFFVLNLTANVIHHGDTLVSKTKRLEGNTGFVCTYKEPAFSYNGVSYPAIPETPLTNCNATYVYPMGQVTLTSGFFRNKNITTSGPYNQFQTIGLETIKFSLVPMSYSTDPLIITVWGQDCDPTVTMTFYPMASPIANSYSLNISQISENSYELRLVSDSVAGYSFNEMSWQIELYNTTNGKSVLQREVKGEHKCIVNTQGLDAGIYIVNVTIGDRTLQEKIVIR